MQRSPNKQAEPTQYAADFQDLPRYVQLRAVQILRMHVMGNVRQRIEAGHRDFVNEIRVCTCLFLGFPSLKVGSQPPAHVASHSPCGLYKCMLIYQLSLILQRTGSRPMATESSKAVVGLSRNKTLPYENDSCI